MQNPDVCLWHNPDLRISADERPLTGGFRTPGSVASDGTTLGDDQREARLLWGIPLNHQTSASA